MTLHRPPSHALPLLQAKACSAVEADGPPVCFAVSCHTTPHSIAHHKWLLQVPVGTNIQRSANAAGHSHVLHAEQDIAKYCCKQQAASAEANATKL